MGPGRNEMNFYFFSEINYNFKLVNLQFKFVINNSIDENTKRPIKNYDISVVQYDLRILKIYSIYLLPMEIGIILQIE